MNDLLVPGKPAWNTDVIPCPADDPVVMPVEHLEARICELAGHLTAATCQFLLLVADFDARRGWASWEMPSCAAWLSWKCQIAPGTAREQVRVARALGGLPAIREEFAAGRLSYAKVRALTRIAAQETEKDLAVRRHGDRHHDLAAAGAGRGRAAGHPRLDRRRRPPP